MKKLTPDEEQQLITLLRKLEPGYLPYEIFLQFARLVALPIIEFVPLRISKNGDAEVLLLERKKQNDLWAGQLHTPGTVIRATDSEGELDLAFNRILDDELKGTVTSPPHYVSNVLHKSRRGTEQSQIFWVEVLDEPKTGKFYSAEKLPEKLITEQKEFIRLAVKDFEGWIAKDNKRELFS